MKHTIGRTFLSWSRTTSPPHSTKGHRVREILTAKPGQRPSKWMEWEDLRKMMLGWVGYKMMALKITS